MKNKAALRAAVIIGALSALIMFAYLKVVETDYKTKVKMWDVLVAKDYIPEWTMVTPDMVSMEKVPFQYLQPAAISRIKDLIGSDSVPDYVTSVPISKGEQIIATKLTIPTRETGVSVNIPQGMRAVTLPLETLSGLPKLMNPGDRVDIFGTFNIPVPVLKGSHEDFTQKNINALFVQNALIIAIGTRMVGEMAAKDRLLTDEQKEMQEKDKATGQGETEYEKENPYVTLAVTPVDAEKLVFANQFGKIFIALRSFDDEDEIDYNPIEWDDLVNKLLKMTKEGLTKKADAGQPAQAE